MGVEDEETGDWRIENAVEILVAERDSTHEEMKRLYTRV